MNNSGKKVNKVNNEITKMLRMYFRTSGVDYTFINVEILQTTLMFEMDDVRLYFDRKCLEFLMYDYELPYEEVHINYCKIRTMNFVQEFKNILLLIMKNK